MKYILVLAILFNALTANSNEVVIQGSIKGFTNEELRAYVYEDYITLKEKKLASVQLDGEKFRIVFELPTTQEVILKVEDKSTMLYAEPGSIYNIHLSFSEEFNRSKIYDKLLSIEFSFPRANDLNQLISSFNNEYEEFLKKNYNKFIVTGAKEEINEFAKRILAEEKYKQNTYLQNFVKYAIANLRDIAGESRKELKNTYLNNQIILYYNKEYMHFFKQFFQQRFRQFAISKTGAELLKAIMFEEDLAKSLKIIQQGEGINSAALAELFLLNGLFEDYYVKTINQSSNKRMLKQITINGQNNENKLIAQNILSSLEVFKTGSAAPNFLLENSKGDLISLKDLRGKYIYLNFWASWSVPSLKELRVMQNIYSKYRDKVEFVSINLDEDPSKMKKILEIEKYPWIFLHYGNDYEIKEKFRLRTVPTYFLIDADGNLKKAPAEGPIQFEEELHKLK